MKRTHPAFWGAGWAGMFIGALMVIGGLVDAADIGRLMGGYGLMMMGTAVYLLGGLRVLELLRDRAESNRIRRAAIARLTPFPTLTTSSASANSGS